MKQKKVFSITLLFLFGLMFTFVLAGCGENEPEKNTDVVTVNDVISEEKVIEYYANLGFTVKDIQLIDDSNYLRIKMTGDETKDELKELFEQDLRNDRPCDQVMFHYFTKDEKGEVDEAYADILEINGVVYTTDYIDVPDRDDASYWVVLADNKVFATGEIIEAEVDDEEDSDDTNYDTNHDSDDYDSGYSGSFTNEFGTPTTICAHPGCSNYIASSGDTNCCETHSARCLGCGKYIDEDAMICLECTENALYEDQ